MGTILRPSIHGFVTRERDSLMVYGTGTQAVMWSLTTRLRREQKRADLMAKRVSPPTTGGPSKSLLLVAVFTIAVTACSVKQEQRIKDPNCDDCYELPSGVPYKTFEYYDP